jgi:hypothetical protein
MDDFGPVLEHFHYFEGFFIIPITRFNPTPILTWSDLDFVYGEDGEVGRA